MPTTGCQRTLVSAVGHTQWLPLKGQQLLKPTTQYYQRLPVSPCTQKGGINASCVALVGKVYHGTGRSVSVSRLSAHRDFLSLQKSAACNVNQCSLFLQVDRVHLGAIQTHSTVMFPAAGCSSHCIWTCPYLTSASSLQKTEPCSRADKLL